MAIEAVQAIAADELRVVATSAAVARPVASEPVSTWFAEQLERVDTNIKVAGQGVRQLALGENVELHRVMLDIERARISLELFTQVRNRVVEAYQEILRMQV